MSKNVADFFLGDIQPAPGAPLPMEDASPPWWVLRTLTRNTGMRLKKLERQHEYAHNHHGFGGGMYLGEDGDYSEGYPVGGWGPHPKDANTSGVYAKALSRRERREQAKAARNEVPRGNLGESDYQFWRGSAAPTYKGSFCRWCERMFYNLADRQAHFKSETNCSRLIRTVQDFAILKDERFCFACGAATRKLRWGFPLCNTITCIGAWKFGSIVQHQGYLMYKRLAREAGVLTKWEVGSHL